MVGKELLLFTSALGHAGLLCLLLCPQSNPSQARTDSVLQKNLTSSSKNKSTFKQDFGYSKFSTEAAFNPKNHFKNCTVTVQTLLHAECNLYVNPKQI